MRGEITKKLLIEAINEAIDKKMDLAIEITIPNQEETDIIISKNKSLKNKIEYYCRVYDEYLIHVMNADVQIVGVYMGEFCCQIEGE